MVCGPPVLEPLKFYYTLSLVAFEDEPVRLQVELGLDIVCLKCMACIFFQVPLIVSSKITPIAFC